MEPQERELITTLLTRLKNAAGQPKDPEADAMIRQAMTQIPDAPYYLVQTVLIQDLALSNAQNRIADLEKQVASLPPPQQQPTSFLGGLFSRGSQPAAGSGQPSGPWTRAPQAAPQYAQQPQYAPQPQYAQPQYTQGGGGLFGGGGGGGGFLRSAAATAAGVAGGALLFEGISSLFGHNYASGLGGLGGGGMQGGLGETVINNYYGDQGGGGDGGYAGGDGGGYAGGDGGYDGGGGGGGYDGGGGGYDSGGGGDDFGGGDFGGGSDNSSC